MTTEKIKAGDPGGSPPVHIHVEATILSISTLVALLIAFGVVTLVTNTFACGVDDSDLDSWHRSGMTVATDHKTGLQYLRTGAGGITPRMDAEGRQVRVSNAPATAGAKR